MAAIPFHFRVWSDDSSIKIAVISFYPDTPVVTCSGGAVSLGARTSVGANDPGLLSFQCSYGAETTGAPTGVGCFSWVGEVSPLSSDTQYTISVTQNGTERTGSARTQLSPTDESDFSFFFITCDGRDLDGTENGCFSYIRNYAENNKVVAVIHPDDHGYSNSFDTDDLDGNLRFCTINPASSAGSSGYDYKYAVAYCGYLGLLENTAGLNNTKDGVPEQNYDELKRRFQSADRQWCWQNISFIVVPGDHEISNNTEEKTTITASHFSHVKSVWVNTLAACQNFINVANSVATRDVLGCVEVICPDRIFGLTALNAVVDVVTRIPTGTSWLGANQKSDIRGEVDSTSVFKLFGMSMSIRDIMSTADQIAINSQAPYEDWAYSALGAQQPLHDYTLVAGDSDFTDTFTNISLGGALNFSSGYKPVVAFLHGDTHRPYEYYHYHPGDASYAPMDFYEISCGTVNGKAMHGLHTSIDINYQYSPVTVTWIPPFTTRNQQYDPSAAEVAAGYTAGDHVPTCLRIDLTHRTGEWVMTINTVRCDSDNVGGSIIRTVVLNENKVNAPEYLRKGTI